LHGAVLHRHALAGFRRRGARRRHRLVPRPRAALRAHERAGRAGETSRGRLSLRGVLAARIVTAAVLVAGLLVALFLLPRPALALIVALVVGAAGLEWAHLCRLGKAAAGAYALFAAACVAVP